MMMAGPQVVALPPVRTKGGVHDRAVSSSSHRWFTLAVAALLRISPNLHGPPRFRGSPRLRGLPRLHNSPRVSHALRFSQAPRLSQALRLSAALRGSAALPFSTALRASTAFPGSWRTPGYFLENPKRTPGYFLGSSNSICSFERVSLRRLQFHSRFEYEDCPFEALDALRLRRLQFQ